MRNLRLVCRHARAIQSFPPLLSSLVGGILDLALNSSLCMLISLDFEEDFHWVQLKNFLCGNVGALIWPLTWLLFVNGDCFSDY